MTPDIETIIAQFLANRDREIWDELSDAAQRMCRNDAAEIIAIFAEHQRAERKQKVAA